MQKQQAQFDINLLARRSAGLRLLTIYSELFKNKKHLLGDLIGVEGPQQWEHYPANDAVDEFNGYQWFYHSHSPEDRRSSREHGHMHLFSRFPATPLSGPQEIEDSRPTDVHHLLGIGLDAQGVPISIFTVNGWVTGDSILSKTETLKLLSAIKLNTGYSKIDAVITAVIHLCFQKIQEALDERDQKLSSYDLQNPHENHALEVLSEISIDLDAEIRACSHDRRKVTSAPLAGR